MKRKRGFRLGRRLIRVWRCVVLRRPNRYQRLDSITPKPSKPRLFDWARRFFACSGGGGGGGGGGRDYRPIETSCAGEKPPPRGHLAVYVGSGVKGGQRGRGAEEGGSKRYVVPVIYFNHPLFGELLREAEEEFGYEHPGGITIPCPIATFERVRTRIIAESTKAQLFH
ncbi:putative small auxin-up RNA [Dioscorea sansibarensis]